MSLTTPTTQDINNNIIAQLEASFGQTIPLLPKAFNRVLAKALAGVFILLYKYAGFMFLQIFVRTASTQPTEVNGKIITPLVELGRLVGAGDPGAATQAELLIDITVENPTGTLPSGTQLVNSSNGVTYITLAAVTLVGSTVQATVRAVADQQGGGGAGTIGNLDPGAIVSFANPLANVAQDATVNTQTVTGADGEDLDVVYRQRVLDRFQKRPQGGAYADYQQWAKEVVGIVNAYPYTSPTPGQVDVYCEATVASSGSADGTPTGAQLVAVAEAIELDSSGLATRRPAGATVNVVAITRTAFDADVAGLSVSDPATVMADIEAALTDFFLERAPFITGLSVLPRLDRIAATGAAGIVDDIVNAAGGTFTGLTLTTGGGPVTVYTLGNGEKAKLGTVTYS